METREYKTKTIMNEDYNPFFPGSWSIAIDIGYSSVKCMSPNKTFSFPTFVKKCDDDTREIVQSNGLTLRFRDKNGTEYEVGGLALVLADIREVNDNTKTMYGRDWYGTETYQICMETALGLALLSNKKRSFKNEAIKVVTGLPCKYTDDAKILKRMITGRHTFDLILPNRTEWEHFDFEVCETVVLPQPSGAMLSAMYDNTGKMTSEGQSLNNENIVVFDGGFGTLDLYGVISGVATVRSTYSDCGMKEVFLRTVSDIKKNYDTEIPVPMLYKYLDNGNLNYFELRPEAASIDFGDPKTYIKKNVNISEILCRHSAEVAKSSLQHLLNDTSHLSGYNYVILSGGSAAAWSDYLTKAISALEVCIVDLQKNNNRIDPIFYNVRGYYMFLFRKLREERSEKQ